MKSIWQLVLMLTIACPLAFAEDEAPNHCFEVLREWQHFGAGPMRLPYFNTAWTVTHEGKYRPIGMLFERLEKMKKVRGPAYRSQGNTIKLVERNDELKYYVSSAIQLDNEGRIESVTMQNNADPDRLTDTRKTFHLGVRNGICYVKKITTEFRREKKSHVVVDTDLCRDILHYFDAHPDATDCRCGDKDTEAELQKIFATHRVDPKSTFPIVFRQNTSADGKTTIAVSQRRVPEQVRKADAKKYSHVDFYDLSLLISKPLSRAISEANTCTRHAGIVSAIKDERIWK